MAITFTQYFRPVGRQRRTEIDRPPEVETKALALVSVGCRLEAEVLRSGDVSLTVERDDADGEPEVIASALVQNGPGVPLAVDRMIATAHRRLFGGTRDE